MKTKLEIAYEVIKAEYDKQWENREDMKCFYQALGLVYALGVLYASFKKFKNKNNYH